MACRETMIQAAATALRERLSREPPRRESAWDVPTRLAALSSRLRGGDTRPVDPPEWNEAAGGTA